MWSGDTLKVATQFPTGPRAVSLELDASSLGEESNPARTCSGKCGRAGRLSGERRPQPARWVTARPSEHPLAQRWGSSLGCWAVLRPLVDGGPGLARHVGTRRRWRHLLGPGGRPRRTCGRRRGRDVDRRRSACLPTRAVKAVTTERRDDSRWMRGWRMRPPL